MGVLLRVNGAVDGAVFTAYLDQVLGPTLRPGDVVVLDNLSVHKVDGLEQVVKKCRARLLYLPPILTRLNSPSADLKPGYTKAQARTRDALEKAIRTAAKWISAHDAKSWFDHCGYHVH